MDSRLRGNDGKDTSDVIFPEAGVHWCSPIMHAGAPDTTIAGDRFVVPANSTGAPSPVIPAKAGMKVRTARPGTSPTVIPAKAGIHRCSPMACDRTSDTSAAGAITVIPAKAGIHRCSPMACDRAPDTPAAGAIAVIPAKAGIHRCSPMACDRAPDTPAAGAIAVIPAKAGIHGSCRQPFQICSRAELGCARAGNPGYRPTTDSSQRKCGRMIRSMKSSTCSISGAAGWMVTCSMPASSSVRSLATMSPTLPSR